MADDISSPLAPAHESAGALPPTGVGGFSRGSAATERPRRWRRTVAVASALVLLGAVGAAAALTGSGPSSDATPQVGASRSAVAPPEIVFTSTAVGYVFFADCKRNLVTDGCPPQLLRTANAGRTWQTVQLPVGAPSTPSLWGQLQVTAGGIVLPWSNGVFLSRDGGDTWTAPPRRGGTAAVPPGTVVVDESDQTVLVDPVLGTAKALAPTIPVTTPWATGTLSGNRVWIKDVREFAVSSDGGRSWHRTLLTGTHLDVVRAAPAGALLVRLQVPLAVTTLGVAGDGGEYPVESVLFSRDNGTTWQRTPVSGPAVNGACTVLMTNGDLLGVAVDGSGLLRLPAGRSVFVPVTQGPRPVPSCLSGDGAGVYGPTFSGGYVTSADGTTWRTVPLPTR